MMAAAAAASARRAKAASAMRRLAPDWLCSAAAVAVAIVAWGVVAPLLPPSTRPLVPSLWVCGKGGVWAGCLSQTGLACMGVDLLLLSHILYVYHIYPYAGHKPQHDNKPDSWPLRGPSSRPLLGPSNQRPDPKG